MKMVAVLMRSLMLLQFSAADAVQDVTEHLDLRANDVLFLKDLIAAFLINNFQSFGQDFMGTTRFFQIATGNPILAQR